MSCWLEMRFGMVVGIKCHKKLLEVSLKISITAGMLKVDLMAPFFRPRGGFWVRGGNEG